MAWWRRAADQRDWRRDVEGGHAGGIPARGRGRAAARAITLAPGAEARERGS